VRLVGVVELAAVLGAVAVGYVALSAPTDRPFPWPTRGLPACDGFDFPVGAPDAVGYHDAQPFGVNEHLGSDWRSNGVGDPVYAVAAGIVVDATDIGGDWGNVVRVVHACGVESLYAHLDRVDVARGATVQRGQPIGTIATAGGWDPPHVHFEIRDRPLPLGGGYDSDTTGYVDPTAYIRAHRPRTSR
jgi:murein DD-endopeptidase MepM/ murein hydrolase activator NlpD